jgi:hypothetical protein
MCGKAWLRLLLLVSLAAVALTLACGPSVARITDLQTGRVIEAQMPNFAFSRGGNITATATDGETFSGSASVIPGKPTGTELLQRFASGFARDQGYDNLAFQLDSMPNREEYSATLVGSRGTVLDLMFAVDTHTGRGSGTAQDNKGNHYRIQL